MEKEKEIAEFIKTTKEGRYYIKTSDFFKSEAVQLIVEKLTHSSIYEEIETKKKERQQDLQSV